MLRMRELALPGGQLNGARTLVVSGAGSLGGDAVSTPPPLAAALRGAATPPEKPQG